MDDDEDEALDIPAFALSLPFDSDEREFVRGFQCGAIWGRVRPCPTILVYAENAEMLARIRERYPDAFEVADNGDDWIAVTFPALPENTEGP